MAIGLMTLDVIFTHHRLYRVCVNIRWNQPSQNWRQDDTGNICRQHLFLMDFKALFPDFSSNQSMKSTVPGAEWHRLRPVGFPVAPPRATQRHFGLGRARCQRGVEQNPGTWRGGTMEGMGFSSHAWDCLDGWMDGREVVG